MRDTLIYLTESYPYGGLTEGVFVESELRELRKSFERIVLMPLCREGEIDKHFKLPDGVILSDALALDKTQHNRLLKLKYLLHPAVMSEFPHILKEARSVKNIIKGIYNAINVMSISEAFLKGTSKLHLNAKKTLLYTFWFENTTHAMARLCNQEGWKLTTRAHGHDIYDEAVTFRSHHLREKAFNNISHVYTISKKGEMYLRERFPLHSKKIRVAKLGSHRKYSACIKQWASYPEKRIRLLTVARASAEKRLHLAIDFVRLLACRLPEYRVEWELIGDGPTLPFLRKRASAGNPDNLKITFLGAMQNDDVQKKMAEESADWFLLTSESEGIPVSIGEAMQYGIPVLSTDVGGISELIIDKQTGILLPSYGTPEVWADIFTNSCLDKENHLSMRKASMRRWEDEFNSAMLSGQMRANLEEEAKD